MNLPTTIMMCSATTVAVLLMRAFGADESELARRNGCLACHGGIESKAGPAYREVARKYAGREDAGAVLAERIVKGTGPSGLGWMKAGKASAPFMPPNPGVSRADAEKLAKWILTENGGAGDPSGFVTDTLTVAGAVERPLSLRVGDLRNFPPYLLEEMPVICGSGEKAGQLGVLRGVLLRDIIGKAVIAAPGHNDVKSMIIIATASDGYKAVFSWAELFNSPIGDGVLVFYEQDGKPLDARNGRIAMVSTKDTRTGPRHVKWLKSVEIRKIE